MSVNESTSSPKTGSASSRRLRIIIMSVILLVPLLYGAMYLWSFWDPYARIDRIPVALVNLDRTAQTSGGKALSAGDDLSEQLLQKGTFAWDDVSPEQAESGMRDGTYYLSLTIPEDFSSALASADTTSPTPARITAQYAVARNFVTKQIGERVFSAVRSAASSSASATYLDSMLLGMSDLRGALSDASLGAGTLAEGLTAASEGAATLVDGLGSAKTGARDLNSGTQVLGSGLAELEAGAKSLESGSFALSSNLGKLSQGADVLAANSSRFTMGTKELSAGAVALDAAVRGTVSQVGASAVGARQVESAATANRRLVSTLCTAYEAGEPLDLILAELEPVAAALDSDTARLSEGLSGADSFSAQLSAGSERLRSSSAAVDAGAAGIDGGIIRLAQGLSAAQSGAVALDSGATRVTQGTASATAGASRLSAGSDALFTGLDKLGAGADVLATGLMPAVQGAQTLSAKLGDGATQIPSLEEPERAANSAMMSDPVKLDDVSQGRADNYGTGLAPYFLPLALWVGALIGYLFIDPLPTSGSQDERRPRTFMRAARGFFPMALLALGQTACLGLVVVNGLGLHVALEGWFWVVMAVTSLTFVAVLQFFNAAFGPVGKLIALTMLMLQLTSSGGMFPIETLNPFFEALHPYLPMTYISEALRATISGGTLSTVTGDILKTLAFGVGAFLLTLLSARSRISAAARSLGERVGI